MIFSIYLTSHNVTQTAGRKSKGVEEKRNLQKQLNHEIKMRKEMRHCTPTEVLGRGLSLAPPPPGEEGQGAGSEMTQLPCQPWTRTAAQEATGVDPRSQLPDLFVN